MNNLTIIENAERINKILLPMMNLLDSKNITEGISLIEDENKLFITFNKDCLSPTNQLILEKISRVYNETFFHSDNLKFPNKDRLEYWCPDEYYDESMQITKRCRDKKMVVLELTKDEDFTILGTSIMLANALQEQDPLSLKINENLSIIEQDLLTRQEHYITSGFPDLEWINLCVTLNKDNPLRQNLYATTTSVIEINNPISCDNVVLSVCAGMKEKKYVSFCMDKEELEKVVREYFEKTSSNDEDNNDFISIDNQKMLLKRITI